MPLERAQLIADLSHTDPARRASAAEQLAHLGTDASFAVVALVRAAGDDAEEVREWAVAALEELGPPPATSEADLAALVLQGSPDVGYWAATLLGRLGQASVATASALTTAVADSPHLAVRQQATWALGRFGDAAVAGLSALQKATSETDPRLARLAAEALKRIKGERPVG